MNHLIIQQDDGISAHVWCGRILQALKAGKSVTAITEDRNQHHVIGTGDGLPSYADFGIADHPDFRSLAVSGPSDPRILETIQQAEETTLLAWNLDLLDWATQDFVGFLVILGACAKGRADGLFVTYRMPLYPVQPDDLAAAAALSHLEFATVAGRRLAAYHPDDVSLVRALAPHLPGPEALRPTPATLPAVELVQSWTRRLAFWRNRIPPGNLAAQPAPKPIHWQRISARGWTEFSTDPRQVQAAPANHPLL